MRMYSSLRVTLLLLYFVPEVEKNKPKCIWRNYVFSDLNWPNLWTVFACVIKVTFGDFTSKFCRRGLLLLLFFKKNAIALIINGENEKTDF